MTSTSTSVLWDSSTDLSSGICPKINQLISFLYDPGVAVLQCWDTGEKVEFAIQLFQGSFDFPQPTGSPSYKPHQFSNQTHYGTYLPSAGLLGWWAWCGAWTPSSLNIASWGNIHSVRSGWPAPPTPSWCGLFYISYLTMLNLFC